MIYYNIFVNNGNEYFGTEGKTITANEIISSTADESFVAKMINFINPLIPEQAAAAVLENFCKAAALIMSQGMAIQFRNAGDVAMRIYPDIRVKGDNINLDRAKRLDSNVTEITADNAGDLVTKAGVEMRVKVECQQKFTELLLNYGKASVCRKAVIERARVVRKDDDGVDVDSVTQDTSTGETIDTSTGNGGSDNQPGGMD